MWLWYLQSLRIVNFSGRKSSDVEGGLESSLEIVAPATSDVEFKYTWPIDSFLHQVCTQTVYDVNEVKTEAHKVLFDRLKKTIGIYK